jgi:hypothetical protein
LQTKAVVRSHLIPAALYDYCRTESASPLRVGNDVVFHTDRQIQTYLLCKDCEEILNCHGESWMIPKFARLGARFPLYELTTNTPPLYRDGDGAMYSAAGNDAIEIEKLTHFALGIFWKASVHSWTGRGTEPMIQLGPYSVAIRRWLLRESLFPSHVCLWVSLSRPERALITLNVPVETKTTRWRTYMLYLLGVQFVLSVGKHMDPEARLTCLYNGPENPIFVSDDITENLWRRASKDFAEARKSASYLAARATRTLAKRTR